MKLFILVIISAMFASTALATNNKPWSYHQKSDPITDIDRSIVFVVSDNGNGALAVRCDHEGLNVTVMTETTVKDEGAMTVWRFDKHEPATPTTWVPSVDRSGIYLPYDNIPQFIANMKTGIQVVVRLIDKDYNPYTYTFNLIGFTRQYNKLGCRLGNPT